MTNITFDDNLITGNDTIDTQHEEYICSRSLLMTGIVQFLNIFFRKFYESGLKNLDLKLGLGYKMSLSYII